MRDDIILKLQRIIEGKDRITWDLFPSIYDGFLESDELSLAEDRMLQLVASAVQTATNDKIISTSSAEKVAEYETEFGLSSSGLTLDERRKQVIDYINRSRVINEEKLHDLCQSLAPDFTVYEKTDTQALTLGIFTEEDDAQGHLPAVGIVDEIRPTVPQNLALYAGVDASFERGVVVNHANYTALWASLGQVERKADSVSGYMTETADFPFETPRGTISTASNILVNGGEKYDTISTALNELSYGGGEQQYMEEVTEGKGYLRSSAYQTSNRALAANTEYYLYPEGSDTTVDGDASYTYTLTGAYTAAGVLVDITGALLTVSGSKLKLVWGSTAASVCYVTYTEGV